MHALQQFDGVHPDSKRKILEAIQNMSRQSKPIFREPQQEMRTPEGKHEKTHMERLTEGLKDEKAEKEKGISEILGLEE